jgi:hypothetical protein
MRRQRSELEGSSAFGGIERYSSGRKKHLRRCANEIEKKFKCPYNNCDKFYGSEGSLNLHMKLKHNAGSKTEREKTAK